MAGFSLITVLLISGGCLQRSPQTTNVLVAIVAYEDFHAEFEHFEHLFAELSQRDPALRFQLAVGSYGEVLHWIDRRLVDVAVLTPGAFASVLPSDGAARAKHVPDIWLPSSFLQPRPNGPLPQRRAAGFHDSYRSVCLVSESSTLRNVDDLRTAVREDRVELLLCASAVGFRSGRSDGSTSTSGDRTDKRASSFYVFAQSIDPDAERGAAGKRTRRFCLG